MIFSPGKLGLAKFSLIVLMVVDFVNHHEEKWERSFINCRVAITGLTTGNQNMD
jgi:hypothetical protein